MPVSVRGYEVPDRWPSLDWPEACCARCRLKLTVPPPFEAFECVWCSRRDLFPDQYQTSAPPK